METQELEKVLQDNDATVIPFDANCSFSSYRNKDIIDYTLLPMTIPAPTSNNNPSTVYWMVCLNYLLIGIGHSCVPIFIHFFV